MRSSVRHTHDDQDLRATNFLSAARLRLDQHTDKPEEQSSPVSCSTARRGHLGHAAHERPEISTTLILGTPETLGGGGEGGGGAGRGGGEAGPELGSDTSGWSGSAKRTGMRIVQHVTARETSAAWHKRPSSDKVSSVFMRLFRLFRHAFLSDPEWGAAYRIRSCRNSGSSSTCT